MFLRLTPLPISITARIPTCLCIFSFAAPRHMARHRAEGYRKHLLLSRRPMADAHDSRRTFSSTRGLLTGHSSYIWWASLPTPVGSCYFPMLSDRTYTGQPPPHLPPSPALLFGCMGVPRLRVCWVSMYEHASALQLILVQFSHELNVLHALF